MGGTMTSLLYAQQGAGQQGSGGLMMFLPLVLIFVIFYFMLIRPQQQQKKKHHELLENLKRGSKVVTSAGIHGSIIKINKDTVIIQICPKSELTIDKTAIAQVL